MSESSPSNQESAEKKDSSRVIDVARNQKNQSDLLFALRSWNPRPNLPRQSASVVREKVLRSRRLVDLIDRLACEGKDRNVLMKQAELILVEMGNTFNLSTVRMLGLFFSKLIRQLYQGLTIDEQGVEQLRAALNRGPVLLLPTHRSYADFILISYLFFTLDLPMPVIAAGMDFKGMKHASKILQNAGAFYIRRSFRQDLLYWTLVSEYVRHHVIHFQAPIEFFLEGTRSRIGKSLPPKSGLLSMALEPYLAGEVYDIQVCTLSISYERTLEENLYAYEVLGVPKPKETTSGFIAAVDRIRGENFGRIYINVGQPISVRDHLNPRRHPNRHKPLYRFDPNEEQIKQINQFSRTLVRQQQSATTTPVFALLAFALSNGQSTLDQLEHRFIRINELLAQYGTPCVVSGDVRAAILESLSVHKAKIQHSDGKFSYRLGQSSSNNSNNNSGRDLQIAAARLVLQQYTNQLLAHLINLALLAFVQKRSGELRSGFSILSRYLKDEFLLVREIEDRDLSLLQSTPADILDEIQQLVEPYVESLCLLVHVIKSGHGTVGNITAQYKAAAQHLIESGATAYAEIAAIDKIPRFLSVLVEHGNVQRIKSSTEHTYRILDLTHLDVQLDLFVSSRFVRQMRDNPQSHVRSML